MSGLPEDARAVVVAASNRAAAGVYADRSGQALAEGLRELGFTVEGPHVRPDDVADDAVEITATVRTTDRTGVEMEALTAVSVAALTVVDMVKAVDKGAVISDVRLESKSGGKSGDWARS